VNAEELDVLVGPNPESELVYVVDQYAANGKFERHQCLLGFFTEASATKAYLETHSAKGFGGITPLTMEDFKQWAFEDGDSGEPAARQFAKEVGPEPGFFPVRVLGRHRA